MAELRNEIKLPEIDGGVIPLMKSNLFPSFILLNYTSKITGKVDKRAFLIVKRKS